MVIYKFDRRRIKLKYLQLNQATKTKFVNPNKNEEKKKHPELQHVKFLSRIVECISVVKCFDQVNQLSGKSSAYELL